MEKSQNENGEERVPDQCVVIQLVSRVWLFVNPWTPAHHASPSYAILSSIVRVIFDLN